MEYEVKEWSTDVRYHAIFLCHLTKRQKLTSKIWRAAKGSLAALVKECESYKKDWFTSGWDEFDSALKQAKIVLEDKNATPEKRNEAETALKKAKDGLVKREKIHSRRSVCIPMERKSNATLEAEFAELTITLVQQDEKWKLSVSDG